MLAENTKLTAAIKHFFDFKLLISTFLSQNILQSVIMMPFMCIYALIAFLYRKQGLSLHAGRYKSKFVLRVH